MNRSGRWAEAAASASSQIEDPGISLEDKCEAYFNLVYAELRLGRLDAAGDHMGAFDRTCADVKIPWLGREAGRLRAELEGQKPSDDGWEPIPDPRALGLDREVLAEHARLCDQGGADACLLVYRGRIVQDWHGSHYREPMYAMSSTKSITGLLVGMLVGDGKLAVDDEVSRYIPQWRAGKEHGVTVRHLLTMTSGLPSLREDGIGGVRDKEAFVFALPLPYEPGTRWAYSNEGVFLLSPLLDRAAGEPIEDYARHRLFGPIGMSHTRLHVYPKGQAWTHADMETTPRDLARIGLLMLNHGRWHGRQLVPEHWIVASTKPSQDLRPNYGLLWWLIPDPPGFAALGRFETNLYVFPGLDLVAVRMQSRARPGAGPYQPAALDLFRRLRSHRGDP